MTAGTATTGPPLEAAPRHGWFVYGVVEAGSVLPEGLTGVEDSPVRLAEHGPIAAVVGELDLERTTGRRADLVAYNEVLNTIAATMPVAPVRFGSVMVDAESITADLLAPQAEQLSGLLTDLAGRSQVNLRATFHEPVVLAEVVAEDPEVRRLHELTRDLPQDAAYPERVRLGELVAGALEAKREAEAAALLDSVLPLAAAYSLREGGGPDHVLDVALLVDDDRVTELEDHLEQLAEAVHERIRLRLVGPIAAYDFVGGDPWA